MTDRRDALHRPALARLVMEHLLLGHLIDRAGMPLLLAHVSPAVMAEVAIEEWRGASPLYTRRMQRLLGFEGDDVTTIFKGMQLDIGAPPQFMDFRYEVHDRDHGEFRLAHCGALMDVEPMGDEMVTFMCHDIEDPTFPATACASNARARVEPVHRPPRSPDHRFPHGSRAHCHWTVTIDEAFPAADEPGEAIRLAESHAARLPLADPGTVADGDGRRWYDGPLEADVDLPAFAAPVLRAVDDEVCLQGHLLVLSFLMAVVERLGAEVATELGRGQLTGIGAVAADRLVETFVADDVREGLDAVATVLDLHPAFRPRSYVDLRLERRGDALRVALHPCPALGEAIAPSWPALLAAGRDDPSPLDAIVQAVDPTARCTPVAVDDGAVAAWDVVLTDTPADEPAPVTLARFSSGAAFRFR